MHFSEDEHGTSRSFRVKALSDLLIRNTSLERGVISSLPYFLEQQTDAQRGHGVFPKSIEALHRLNAVGYGTNGDNLVLNLVYKKYEAASSNSLVGSSSSYYISVLFETAEHNPRTNITRLDGDRCSGLHP